ncbi:MAG: hypothetical protein HC904_03630 [Blastochloris sp.]|nr:hypothetical protein [Blastochloris sp.]
MSFKRLFFLYESAAEIPAEIRLGKVVEQLGRLVEEQGYESIAVTESVAPRFRVLLEALKTKHRVELFPEIPLVSVPDDYVPKRFSPFWKKYGREWGAE